MWVWDRDLKKKWWCVRKKCPKFATLGVNFFSSSLRKAKKKKSIDLKAPTVFQQCFSKRFFFWRGGFLGGRLKFMLQSPPPPPMPMCVSPPPHQKCTSFPSLCFHLPNTEKERFLSIKKSFFFHLHLFWKFMALFLSPQFCTLRADTRAEELSLPPVFP